MMLERTFVTSLGDVIIRPCKPLRPEQSCAPNEKAAAKHGQTGLHAQKRRMRRLCASGGFLAFWSHMEPIPGNSCFLQGLPAQKRRAHRFCVSGASLLSGSPGLLPMLPEGIAHTQTTHASFLRVLGLPGILVAHGACHLMLSAGIACTTATRASLLRVRGFVTFRYFLVPRG